MLRFLSNIYNPDLPGRKHFYEVLGPEYLEENNKWLSNKVIGDPQPTEAYTVEELKAKGMVGVYVEE